MTTVAFDGTTLAADTLGITGGNLKRRVHKLFRLANGNLLGGAGEYDSVLKAFEWFEAGDMKAPKPTLHESFAALLVTPQGCFKMEQGLMLSPVLEPFIAIGSGRDFAITAMHLGKNALEALEITLLYDANTGGPIDVMKRNALKTVTA